MTLFFVAGKPAPQGSKRHVGNGRMIESSKALKPWRELIAETARWNRPELHTGPVLLKLDFIMPRPKATPKTATPPAIKRPDLDKLVRAVLDSLTGICYVDDSQVTDIIARKHVAGYEDTPGVYINCEPIIERLAA